MTSPADSNRVQGSGPRSPDSPSFEHSPTIEKGTVEARQGYRGLTVLYILVISLVLAIVAYLVLHFYFLGGVP
jgi:hypothetical protein